MTNIYPKATYLVGNFLASDESLSVVTKAHEASILSYIARSIDIEYSRTNSYETTLSVAQIAKYCRCKRTAAKMAIKHLIDKKLLKKTQDSHGICSKYTVGESLKVGHDTTQLELLSTGKLSTFSRGGSPGDFNRVATRPHLIDISNKKASYKFASVDNMSNSYKKNTDVRGDPKTAHMYIQQCFSYLKKGESLKDVNQQ